MLRGRCACGAVQYSLRSDPYDTGWCHCRLCQRVSGSGGMVFTTVPVADYVIEQGQDQVGRFQSTPFGERSYCKACGSPLTIHVRHQADEVDVTVGTLEDPGSVAPAFHLYASEAPPWVSLEDGLARFDALRPTTRGLPPGQTEG
jgi:hypothetical protein